MRSVVGSQYLFWPRLFLSSSCPVSIRAQNMNRIDPSAEWIETDGLGGFASGTVSGIRTRRYHALLLTATTPPTGRVVLVNGFDAWVETPRGTFFLSSQRYAPDVIHPDGASRIESFEPEPCPRWTCPPICSRR